MGDVLLDDGDRRRHRDQTGALMRAPTPSPDAIALEAATTFLRSCVAINLFSGPAGVSFFLPKHGRTKLDAMYRKNFAKLFALARRGDAEADHYLRQELLDEETSLPPAKREALRWLLLNPTIKRRPGHGGRKAVANQDRDFIIAQAVLHATAASGLLATRSPGTGTASGAGVVVEALRQLGLPRMTESNINRIWFAHAKRERAEEMQTVIVLPKV
jgi:hypothetical protein